MIKKRLKLVENNGKFFLEGEFLDMNNTVFESDSLRTGLKEYKTKIKKKTAFGEIYQKDKDPLFEISLRDVSHTVVNYRITKDKKVVGRLRILDTPKGNELRLLATHNVGVYTMLRCAGTVEDIDEIPKKVIKKIFAIDVCLDEIVFFE
jgi:hypothetical protein